MTAIRPLLGYTDIGACCGAELVSVPNHQPEVGEYEICRACRHSNVDPLPYDYDSEADA